MPLFQKSVLNKYLDQQDSKSVNNAYRILSKYFHNSTIQQNIRSTKEEQFQEGFLRELFVNVLGYTLNPNPNYNLTTEHKNEIGAKKADGAILSYGKTLGVIELKSTKTKDLENVRQQAFDYKANHTGCVYVITSNFEKIRFYIHNAVDFEEFDLFTINRKRFNLLYLCLSKNSVLLNIPLKIKEASIQVEEAITKKFYTDYSLFKRMLFRDLVKRNMRNQVFRKEIFNATTDWGKRNIKRILFKNSQKLIDRFLFIFFAEDRGLLPPNSILGILEEWELLKELDEIVPLYSRYKKYFNYLDQGRKGTENVAEIFAYNGGLFKPDAILDSLLISDSLLYDHTKALSHYDFESQVDVNILGHIFENSLNEIESVNAEIEGKLFNKQATKRKKDGVFYTPKFITKYIIDNTLGHLCRVRKSELSIIEEEYYPKRQIRTKKKLLFALNTYREWLLQLSILDPACGSGAFLNQALDFLIKEHHLLNELQTKLRGGGFVFPDIESTVLENNIYGVDLNEESIDIARLSLWLRTAQPRRKLNDLSNNIKCGNSLINRKSLAGDKAFYWEKKFESIIDKGGFDVVIGNPPYVSHDRVDHKQFLKENYKCHQGFADLFCYFYELGINLLKPGGVLSYITSNSFLRAEYGAPLRKLLLETCTLNSITNMEDAQIFSDAIVNSSILTLSKGISHSEKCQIVNKKYDLNDDFWTYIDVNKFYYNQNDFDELPWNLSKPEYLDLRNKIKSDHPTLSQLGAIIKLGLATGFNEAFVISDETKRKLIIEDSNSKNIIKPMLRGKDINKYFYTLPNLSLLLTKNGIDVKNEYPAIFNHLDSFGSKFKARGAKGQHWTNLRACSFFEDFKREKIVWIELTDEGRFSYCDEEVYLLNSAYFLLPPPELNTRYLLAVLNSNIIKYYLKQIANTSGVGTTRWINIYVKEFPIPIISDTDQAIMGAMGKEIENLILQKYDLCNKFSEYLSDKYFSETKLPRKLKHWYSLNFQEFINILNKSLPNNSVFSNQQEMDWHQLFTAEQSHYMKFNYSIRELDQRLNKSIGIAYGLSVNDIKMVEEYFNG